MPTGPVKSGAARSTSAAAVSIASLVSFAASAAAAPRRRSRSAAATSSALGPAPSNCPLWDPDARSRSPRRRRGRAPRRRSAPASPRRANPARSVPPCTPRKPPTESFPRRFDSRRRAREAPPRLRKTRRGRPTRVSGYFLDAASFLLRRAVRSRVCSRPPRLLLHLLAPPGEARSQTPVREDRRRGYDVVVDV